MLFAESAASGYFNIWQCGLLFIIQGKCLSDNTPVGDTSEQSEFKIAIPVEAPRTPGGSGYWNLQTVGT